MCEKHDAEIVNLSKTKKEVINYDGEVFKRIKIPGILLRTDLITLPVMKTHCITGLTASLKNQ